ncbi:MAG TPA: replicative DNA helicase [Longimicrobium sp.]
MSTPAIKIATPSPGAPSPFTDRTPPYSAEAEMAVLGGMLIDQDAVVRAVEIVDDSMFHREAHRRLFRALVRIWQRGDVIDEITVTDDLKKAGDFEAVGGVAFLASLLDAVPTAANIDYHCKIVREKAILRRLIEASTSIIQETYAWQGEVENLMDLAEQRIFQLAQSNDRRGFVWIKEILWPTFEKIEQLQANQSAITGVPSGFHDLDELTAGFQNSDLVIVAARPSMGKCLAYDAEIVLEDGSVATIEELYRRRSARLLTLNDGWKLEMTEPSAFVDDGEKPVFRVTTRLGRRIETTLTHPFLTVGGWKRLEEIRVGDHVAVPRRLGVFGSEWQHRSDLAILAYLLKWHEDGRERLPVHSYLHNEDFHQACIESGLRLASSSLPWQSGLPDAPSLSREETADALWSTATSSATAVVDAVASSVLKEHLEEAASGSLPEAIFRLNRADLAFFLNRMFAAHGLAGLNITDDRVHVWLFAPSVRIAEQIQHLLLRFGILCGHQRTTLGSKLWILDESLPVFTAEIGIFGQQDRLERYVRQRPQEVERLPADVWKLIAAEKGDESWPTVLDRAGIEGSDADGELTRDRLRAFAVALDSRRLLELAESDVYWDEVVSIEPVGIKQVYDLTIPGTHNFVANDVCVHNTAFTLNIAQHAAISAQKPVAFFSLEMSKESLVQRVLCAEARVDASRLRRGRLSDDDYARLAIAAGHLNTAPIYIDDTPGISVLEMRAKARRLKADRDDLSMIIVDYLQLMVSNGKSESRQQEVSEISRGLKALAKELDIPVIALSQLSRAVESRPDKRPMMSDLRESGAIEQDADVIMFLYRPEYYFGPVDKEGNSLEGKAELIVGKQRNGATGNVPLFFRKEFTLFESMSSYRTEE